MAFYCDLQGETESTVSAQPAQKNFCDLDYDDTHCTLYLSVNV